MPASHDCANRARLQEPRRRNLSVSPRNRPVRGDFLCKGYRHGIVSGIIIRPYFRQAPAALGCDNTILRWPGPFGSGFLSPQPPGVVRIGPVRSSLSLNTGPTRVGPFLFGDCANTSDSRESYEPGILRSSREFPGPLQCAARNHEIREKYSSAAA